MGGSRRAGRLFRKFFFAQWVGIALTVVCMSLYFHLTGARPPLNDGRELMLFGVIPLVPVAATLVGMLATSLGLAWYLTRPIRQLSWALHQVAEGHLETRVRERMGRRNDEIVDLAGDFDRMARQLQSLTESRKQLLHDISHELRSPLARLQVAIGLLRQEPGQLDSMLDRIERESQRLDTLIEELLTWHRLEAGAMVPALSRIDVMDLLQAIAEDAHFEAQAAGKSVFIDARGGFVTQAQGELIYRALENVVRNAVKFTPPGGSVQVSAHVDPDSDQFVCLVEDRGPGVPAEMLESIFQPFARVAGTGHAQGVGLGLAIARRAFALHGGHIEARQREGGGLTMRMSLPRAVLYPP